MQPNSLGRKSMSRKSMAAIVALALLMAACGDTASPGETGTPDTDSPPSGGEATINLVVNPWTASALNVQVAAQIIESELGNPVEIVDIDENTMFTGLSDGSLDAALEIWPSGVTADEQAYFDDGTVVDIGELGTVGKIGWFVPQYVLDEFPALASWEGFQDPAVAEAFATAETGSLGRFLGTDPSYAQYDEAIIENLGLPLQVVFSGSEPATFAELDTRVAANEPIVMYWWTPTAAVATYDLVNIPLPDYSDECYADPAAIDCDYPEDVLFKAASAALADKDPSVYSFLQNFALSTEDQLSMLPGVEVDGLDPSEVAAQWIEDNESVWRAWLP
ncbi:ABC transporter substrate-binding protein [soil metagenome]